MCCLVHHHLLDSKKATGSVDLGAVPRTTPSLGQHPGRARRDLVARSSVKRRLPTNRGALLFKVIIIAHNVESIILPDVL